ncbi:MAG: hypothetical protein JSV05_02650 [Candidatus Bathyarchaeota archaeon]|nr:MAG: hypothetical protein JSV05_02650 [Candidatus Bathyarchaeota archaeon]
MNEKVKIYVCTLDGVSAFDYVDKESIGHPCVTSRHAEDLFTEWKHFPGSNGVLPQDQKDFVNTVAGFCKKNAIEYEIIDMAKLGLMGKMKLALKGLKAPVITYGKTKINGLPKEENLKALLL